MAGCRGLCLLPLLLLLLCPLLGAAAPGGERSASCCRWVLEPWARLGSTGDGRACRAPRVPGWLLGTSQLRGGLRAVGLQTVAL